MAARPSWRGHLRLALVSCPVALLPALQGGGDLRFHWINPRTGNRVRSVMHDAGTGAEVARQELVKGYEYEKERFILLEDADFEAARIESSATIAIAGFVPADAIDPVHFDTPYYMVPDGEAGLDVYAVLQKAIADSGRVGLSRVVIARRERAIMLRAAGRGLVVHTLHEAGDLHDPDEAFDAIPGETPEREMVTLARQLIERQSGRFDPAAMEDRYESRLREVIRAKLDGKGVRPAAEDPAEGKVIDLMAALKRSLSGKDDTKTAAKVAAKGAAKAAAKGTAKAAPKAGRETHAVRAPAKRRARR